MKRFFIVLINFSIFTKKNREKFQNSKTQFSLFQTIFEFSSFSAHICSEITNFWFHPVFRSKNHIFSLKYSIFNRFSWFPSEKQPKIVNFHHFLKFIPQNCQENCFLVREFHEIQMFDFEKNCFWKNQVFDWKFKIQSKGGYV